MLDRARRIWRRFRGWAPADQPRDRGSRERAREGPEGGGRTSVRPLGIVDDDRHRPDLRSPLQQVLEVVEQPEPLPRLGPDRRERGPGDERLGPVEQRTEQCCELDRSLARLGHRHAEAHPPPPRFRDAFEEEPGLADATRTLDDDDATGTGGDLVEASADQPELRLAALDSCLIGPRRRRLARTGVGHLAPWSGLGRHSIRRAYAGRASP